MIYGTVKLKSNLKYLPKSEAPQSVDQWFPLVAVGSVLLTVLISRMRTGVKQHREDKRIILLSQLDTLSLLIMSGTRLASRGRLLNWEARWRFFVVVFEEVGRLLRMVERFSRYHEAAAGAREKETYRGQELLAPVPRMHLPRQGI